MGLDFTNIADREGAALYFIHDGQSRGQAAMAKLADEVSRNTNKQIIILSATDSDARRIIEFYHLQGSNMILIIRDNDQLQHMWQQNETPQAEHIAYIANQVG